MNNIDRNMQKLNKLFFTLTIAWMVVIFIFSAQTGDTSANLSGGITEAIVSFIFSDFETYSPEKQLSILDTAHYIIRKGAHFTEYGILGIFSILTLLTYVCKDKVRFTMHKVKGHMLRIIPISLMFCALYAVSDEIHQGFTDNRYPALTDVLIDSSGALCGILFTSLMFYIFHIKKSGT
ncbi:MAG: VanZ family protein [Lachnospiraceae bacterium]|nr:VanZ family protein [Lachnospiraceae bacterium]